MSFSKQGNQDLRGDLRTLRLTACALVTAAGTTAAVGQDAGLAALAGLAGGNGAPAAPAPVDTDRFAGSVNVNEFDLVDLHVSSEDIRAVLQLLSMQSERNILVSPSVQATISADLYGVTFYEALDAILSINGFRYVERGNFIYVFTNNEIAQMEQETRQLQTRVITLNYLNAGDARRFLEPLLSDKGSITIQADTSPSFSIGESGPVGGDSYVHDATLVLRDLPENIEEILRVAREIDTRPVQVLVESTILQARLNEANAFGVDFAIIGDMDFLDFFGEGAGGPLGVVNGLIRGTGETTGGATVPATGADGNGRAVSSTVGNTSSAGGFKAGVVSGDVAVFLRLLDEVTDTTVVSNPKILTLNRQPAQVLVGTKVGYLSTQVTETSTIQTVEFLDTGTSLQVRPFVMQDGLIRMELRPKVSSFSPRDVTTSEGHVVSIPDENTNELVTNVMVRDGQTVVLGGLFTESTTATRRQVPFLGDIPVVGAAFRGHDDETVRSEIIFLVTPSIVNDQILTAQGSRAAEYVEASRVGARQGLLPWSRDRRVSRLLIEARRAAEDGDVERANFKIQRAIALAPTATDAIRLREELTGTDVGFPSRSFLEDVLWNELEAFPTAPGASAEPAPGAEVSATVSEVEPVPAAEPVGFSLAGAEPEAQASSVPPTLEEAAAVIESLGLGWSLGERFPFIDPAEFVGWEQQMEPSPETAFGEPSDEVWPPMATPWREGFGPSDPLGTLWTIEHDLGATVTSVPTDTE